MRHLFSVVRVNALLLLANLATGIITARALGPTGRGELAATVTWCTVLAVVLNLGTVQAVVVHRGSVEWLRRWLVGQVVLGGTVGLAVCLALNASGNQPWLGAVGVLGGSLYTAGAIASSLSFGWLQRLGQLGRVFRVTRLLPQVAVVIGMITLWGLDVRRSDIWVLVIGSTVGVVSISALLRNFRVPSAALVPDAPQVDGRADFVRLTAGLWAVGLGSQLLYRLDALAVAVRFEPEKVGYYAIAIGAGAACYSIGSSAGTVVFAALRDAETPEQQRLIILKGLRRAVAISTAVALPGLALTELLITTFYGAEFLPATGATRLLLCAAILLAADYVLVHAAVTLGCKRYVVIAQVLVGTVTVLLLWRATSEGSLLAVATVPLVTYPLSVLAHLGLVLRHTRSEALVLTKDD